MCVDRNQCVYFFFTSYAIPYNDCTRLQFAFFFFKVGSLERDCLLAQSLTSYVTLGKFLTLSVPCHFHLENGDHISRTHVRAGAGTI